MRARLSIGSLALLAFGCAEGDKAASAVEAITFDTVVMHRSDCFGFCPVYTVSISSDGGVSFQGERNVAAIGDRTATIETSAISRLRQALAKADFFALKDQYRYEPDGCTEWRTDNPTVDIIVIAGDRRHQVSYYYGCEIDVAAQINGLATTIDEVADTQKWIGASAL